MSWPEVFLMLALVVLFLTPIPDAVVRLLAAAAERVGPPPPRPPALP